MAAAVKTFTLGISKIELAPLTADGSMPTSGLATLGYTNEGTASLTFNEPEKTEFYAEEVDDPVLVFSKQGKIEFAFDVMNPDVDTLASLIGGRAIDSTTGQPATTSGTNDTWEAPGTVAHIERALKITPRMGYTITIPRADITARPGDNLSKTELFVLHISGTVLAPQGSNAAPKITLTTA